jgi:bifunctional non-homologous end joining protein LigD
VPLDTYRRKRRFGQTPEPRGERVRRVATDDRPAPTTGRFVVQRHRATRLHYDFRLEIEGVLVSWAIPRGPSLDPKHRRLAVHVEDHPIEYFDFEGVIPNQQYGAGDVIVWDWGRWTADPETPDASNAIRHGELKLSVAGTKLRGAFVMIRMAWSEGSKDQWLLIKRRDDDAVPGWDPEDYPESVKTGRTNEDVAARRRPKHPKRGRSPKPR